MAMKTIRVTLEFQTNRPHDNGELARAYGRRVLQAVKRGDLERYAEFQRGTVRVLEANADEVTVNVEAE